jgi:hypothetical protein
VLAFVSAWLAGSPLIVSIAAHKTSSQNDRGTSRPDSNRSAMTGFRTGACIWTTHEEIAAALLKYGWGLDPKIQQRSTSQVVDTGARPEPAMEEGARRTQWALLPW